MKKRISESLLSAYLDGELDSERAEVVAQLAAKHAPIARRLDELRRVKAAVASLPKVKLAGDKRRQLWSAVFGHSDLRNARETALSAAFDGELSVRQAALVDERTTDADAVQHAAMSEVRSALGELPQWKAPASVVAGALMRIAEEANEGAEAAAELQALPVVPAPIHLLDLTVDDLKPVATPRHPVFAFRREGWTTGLAAAIVAGVALFAFSLSRKPLETDGPMIADSTSVDAPDPSTPQARVPAPKVGVVASKSVAPAPKAEIPSIDDPFIDERWLPQPTIRVAGELPAELPKELLELVRPGAKIDVPDTKITLLCLDVQKMKDRLEIVFLKTAVGDKNVLMKEEGNGTIVSVELQTTPSKFAEVLAALRKVEDDPGQRLIAGVDVRRPNAEQGASKDEVRFTEPPALGNISSKAIENPTSIPVKSDAKVAEGTTPKPSPTEAEIAAADSPRRYFLVLRRPEPPTPIRKRG